MADRVVCQVSEQAGWWVGGRVAVRREGGGQRDTKTTTYSWGAVTTPPSAPPSKHCSYSYAAVTEASSPRLPRGPRFRDYSEIASLRPPRGP